MNYAIGDIQGCFDALKRLLEHIHFDHKKDILWFVGDLVNRGPQSLETLRFIKNLGPKHHTVLGNHDLHLLAVSAGVRAPQPKDTLDDILNAPDRDELLTWLTHQPFLYHDERLNFTMMHAGLAPMWDLEKAKALAKEAETILQTVPLKECCPHFYGNQPDRWNDNLQGWDRFRCILIYLTRIRFCYADGRIECQTKTNLLDAPADLVPWFQMPRANRDLNLVFGHWSALNGVTNTPKTYALDTGCVWGNQLTAMRLEDQKRFSVESTL